MYLCVNNYNWFSHFSFICDIFFASLHKHWNPSSFNAASRSDKGSLLETWWRVSKMRCHRRRSSINQMGRPEEVRGKGWVTEPGRELVHALALGAPLTTLWVFPTLHAKNTELSPNGKYQMCIQLCVSKLLFALMWRRTYSIALDGDILYLEHSKCL